jgi:general secretion pathway protein G
MARHALEDALSRKNESIARFAPHPNPLPGGERELLLRYRRHCEGSPSAGFSLIELLVTLALLATLASVTIPLQRITAQRQREETLRHALIQIRNAIDAYKQAFDEGRIERSVNDSGYPPNLAVLASGVRDKSDAKGGSIYFLRSIPRDPFCDCPSRSDEQTWAPRSYASPPNAPREGRDVFDVHSRSTAKGLNGIPYNQW